MEFFTNIWNWIVENKDSIFAIVSSAEFAAVAAVVINSLKNIKTTKENTTTNKALTDALAEQKETTKLLKEENELLKKEISALKDSVEKLTENSDATLTKTSAIVNAMSVVYNSSLKNAETRETVDNILTNAKFSETKTRANLIKTLDEITTANKKQSETIAKLTLKAKETTSSTTAKTTVLRG